MTPSSHQLEELKRATNLNDLRNVTREQFTEVLGKAAVGRLTIEQLKLLVEAMPQFVQLQQETIEGLKKVAEGA